MGQIGQTDDDETLAALMLRSELFCSAVEKATGGGLWHASDDELRLKISQCRGLLGQLQSIYDDNHLAISDDRVRAHTRHLLMTLMWVAFYSREKLDLRLYRQLVMLESSFTFLLMSYISTLESRLH